MIQGHVSARVWRFKSSPGHIQYGLKEVQSSTRKYKGSYERHMKGKKALLRVLVCMAIVAVFATGCKRRPQNYAGLPDPTKGETIDPNK